MHIFIHQCTNLSRLLLQLQHQSTSASYGEGYPKYLLQVREHLYLCLGVSLSCCNGFIWICISNLAVQVCMALGRWIMTRKGGRTVAELLPQNWPFPGLDTYILPTPVSTLFFPLRGLPPPTPIYWHQAFLETAAHGCSHSPLVAAAWLCGMLVAVATSIKHAVPPKHGLWWHSRPIG